MTLENNIDAKSHLLELKQEGKVLTVLNFSSNDMDEISLRENFLILKNKFKSKQLELVIFDLTNLTPNLKKSVSFLDACISFCMSKCLKAKIHNATPLLHAFLKEIDFIITPTEVRIRHKKQKSVSAFVSIGEAVVKFFSDLKSYLGFIGEIVSALIYSIFHPRKIQWKETLYYMDKTGADAVPIVFAVCFLTGAIIAYQGVVQMGRFGLSIFTSDLIGLSMTKELGALMTSMVCIGRAGSSFAAEIGTMQVSEEVDAMETMGLRTSRFLVIPKVIALACVMPFLVIIADVAGILGGSIAAVLKSNMSFQEFFTRTISAISFGNVMEGFSKSIIFAILIAAIGCLRGYEAERDAKGVGRAATSSVVSGIFLIVVADGLLTLVFN
ncbi:MAG: ABC transporter permease [Lentisphaerota bacterium]